MKTILHVALFGICSLAVGCRNEFQFPSGVRVSGKIVLPDQQVASPGRVILKPADEGSFIAFGDIRPDGSFTLVNQRQQEAVVPGRYKVYIAVTDPKHRALQARIPAKYHNFDAESSDVEVTIDAANPNLEIRLKR